MAAIRRATATWQGDLLSGSGTVGADTSGAFGPLPVTWASRTESPDGRTSPEELVAAAHAACYAMAFSNVLAKAGNAPRRLDVSATVTFEKLEAGWRIVSSALSVRGDVPGIEANRFTELAEDAKEGCPISNALSDDIALSVEAALAAGSLRRTAG
jgi:osmotically inducible protein OsmC